MAPTRSLASGIFGRFPLLLCLIFAMVSQLATGRSEPIEPERPDYEDIEQLLEGFDFPEPDRHPRPICPPRERKSGILRHPTHIITLLSYAIALALLFTLAAIANRRSLKRKHLEDVERIRKDSMTELDKTKAELEKLRSELDALRDEVNTLKSRPEG